MFRLALFLCLFSVGCASHKYEIQTQSRPEPVPIAPSQSYAEKNDAVDKVESTKTGGEVLVSGPLKDAPAARARSFDVAEEVSAVQQILPGVAAGAGAANAPPSTPSPIEVQKPPAQQAEMIDIEARVELEVENTETAAARIRSIVAEAGGRVVNEVVEAKPTSAGAALSLRVPTPKVHQVLGALGTAGKILSRKIESKDIGREYHDAQILLQNLEATLRRYEELLAKAQAPPQVLEIEKEMARVRTQLDRVKGDMRWMRDRATMATIYVTLSSPRPDDSLVEPKPSLYPGIRATSLVDFSDGSRAYLGGGLSVRIVRAFSIDADWMTRARNGDGIDLFIASMGSELYSDLLGGGRRRFLNPYLGFRFGYARIRGDGAFAPSGVLGIEIFKTDAVVLELDARGVALIGIEETTHGALQTTLGLNVAY